MMATECYVCKSDPSECINPAIQYCDKQRPWQCNFFITEECQGEENTLEKTLCCKCQNRLFDSVEIKEFKAHNVLCSSDNQVCGWSGTLGGLVDHRTDPKWQCKLKETLSVHHAATKPVVSHHQTQTDSNCNMSHNGTQTDSNCNMSHKATPSGITVSGYRPHEICKIWKLAIICIAHAQSNSPPLFTYY